MKKTVHATVVRCNVTGESGLVLHSHKGWYDAEYSAYVAGFSLGHEIIAHRPKETGRVWEEFRALGAEAWLSDCYCSHNRSNTMTNAQILADDFENSLTDFSNQCCTDSRQIPSIKCKKFEERELATNFFNDAWEILWEAAQSEDSNIYELKDWIESNKDMLLNWFLEGYRYAQNVRYKGFDSYDVFLMRKAINDLKFTEYVNFYEGMCIQIHYDLYTLKASFDC
jgi:hypothetical protein